MGKDQNNGTRASSNRNEVSIGILGQQMTNMESSLSRVERNLEDLSKKIENQMDKASETYTTKSELMEVQKDLDSLRSNINWGVKIVLGAVIIAVLGLVITQVR